METRNGEPPMQTELTPRMDADAIRVRKLRPSDLEPVIKLDARITGRRREEFFQVISPWEREHLLLRV